MDFKGIVYGGKKIEVLDQNTRDMISDAFMEGKAYAVGDYCIHNNDLYKFTAKKDAGPWNDTVVKKTTMAAEQSELNSKTELEVMVRSTYGEIVSYNVAYKINGLYYIDCFININTAVPNENNLLYVRDKVSKSSMALSHRCDAILTGHNGCYLLAMPEKQQWIMVNGVEIPAGFYKLVLITS